MEWPYRFVFGQTPDELAQRRYLLDYYARLAQYSALVPLLLIYGLRYFQQQVIAASAEKGRRPGGPLSWLHSIWRTIGWLSDEETSQEWGTWREVGFATVWGSWLTWCVVHETGDGKLVSLSDNDDGVWIRS